MGLVLNLQLTDLQSDAINLSAQRIQLLKCLLQTHVSFDCRLLQEHRVELAGWIYPSTEELPQIDSIKKL